MLMPPAGFFPTPPCDVAGSRCTYSDKDSSVEHALAAQRAGGEGADSSPWPASLPVAEAPAGARADSDDLRLAVDSLYPDRPPRLPEMRRRTLQGAVRLAVAIVSVFAVAAVVVSSLRSANPPAHNAAEPTPAPSLPPGWISGGPSYAQTIVFAPSAPTTAYTCGAVPLDEPGAPLSVSVGVSHDYGRTWKTLPSPLLSPWCDITVDPTDPQDVVLVTVVCASCSANPPLSIYRTTDGGDDWSLWPLPPWGSGGRDVFSGYEWAWAGSTLFLAQAIDDGRSGYTVLAASVNRGPFVWVGQHRLFAGEPPTAGINSLTGLDGTLYVTFNCGPGCPVTSTHMMRSSDGGATWSPFAPAFQGRTVYLAGTRAASASLFGFTDPGPGEAITSGDYLRSADGGLTWQSMPPFPDMLGLVDITAAPDGTTYAELWACCAPAGRTTPEGIYKLAPGVTQWSFVGQFPGGTSTSIVLSWDTAGHPRALWSPIHQPAGPFQVSPGMTYHLP
jgi:hypothetical protein